MSDALHHHNSRENIPVLPFGELPKGVYVITLLAWTAFIGAFWAGFGSDLNSGFMVAISTVYMLVFFVTPILMLRMARKFGAAAPEKESLNSFLERPVDTNTGEINGREALIQIVLVPVCLAFCAGGIAYAFHSARFAAGL